MRALSAANLGILPKHPSGDCVSTVMFECGACSGEGSRLDVHFRDQGPGCTH